LEDRPGSIEQRMAVREAARKVPNGTPLSEVMRRHPKVFSELDVALVAAGEHGGHLDTMLNANADYLERQREFQQVLSRETFYPKILLLAVLFIPLATQVIIVGMTQNALAAFTVALKALALYALIGVVPAVIIYLVYRNLVASESGRYALDNFKLRVPLIGKVVTRAAWARLCRALAALYSAGVNIPTAIRLAGRTSGNHAIIRAVDQSIPKLEKGGVLSDALAATGQIPSLALSMLRTGEQTGNIDVTMTKVADYFEGEAFTATRQMTIAIVPIAVILFGVIVLLQVVGFYLGHYTEMLQ